MNATNGWTVDKILFDGTHRINHTFVYSFNMDGKYSYSRSMHDKASILTLEIVK
jgi:hypothetical protein